MQVPILSGIYTDQAPDFRVALPRNMMPVPKAQGISGGYLRPADGLVQWSTATPGPDRGGVAWDGVLYRANGRSLVRYGSDGAQTVVGALPDSAEPVQFDYGVDRLAAAAGGQLHYWNGSAFSVVTDPDAGSVHGVLWVDGYFMVHDDQTVAVTDLNDPMSVNPLRYGSSEADPDPILRLMKLRREVIVVNRHTVQYLQNVGGNGFPFAPIDGAMVPKGAVGRWAACVFEDAVAMVGGGRNEPVSVYLAAGGQALPIATPDVENLLRTYTEAQLAAVEVEARVRDGQRLLYVHLPDRALVYDAAATVALKEPVWFELSTAVSGVGQYAARHFAWAYGQWIGGDPGNSRLCTLSDAVSSHYGAANGWEFGTVAVMPDSGGGIVHEVELVTLPGRVAVGADPVVWTSYSRDGLRWSQERAIRVGKRGDTTKRAIWTQQGPIQHWRVQRFRGTSDAHIAAVRLDMRLEALDVQKRGGA